MKLSNQHSSSHKDWETKTSSQERFTIATVSPMQNPVEEGVAQESTGNSIQGAVLSDILTTQVQHPKQYLHGSTAGYVTKLIKETINNRVVRLNISHAAGQALMKNNLYFISTGNSSQGAVLSVIVTTQVQHPKQYLHGTTAGCFRKPIKETNNTY